MDTTTETNNMEICKMMLMNMIYKGIDECIEDGDNQYTFILPDNWYKGYKERFIKDVIIPELTTHTNGESQYSSYRNGFYYFKFDCMCPYTIEYNGSDTLCFNMVESDDEVSDDD